MYILTQHDNVVYKNTQLPEFLQTARHMASYFLDHLPKDGIVPWYVSRLLRQSWQPQLFLCL